MPIEAADVVDEQLGDLVGGEVTASRRRAPPDDVVVAFGVGARPHADAADVRRVHGEAGRLLQLSARRRRRLRARGRVVPGAGAVGVGDDEHHDVVQHLVLREHRPWVAVAKTRPGTHLFENPRRHADGAVRHGVRNRQGFGALDGHVGPFDTRPVGPLRLRRLLLVGERGRPDAQQMVEMNRPAVPRFVSDLARDGEPQVAALRDVVTVAEHVGHQLVPQARGRPCPDGFARLGGEGVAGQRRDHDRERIFDAAAVRLGMGQRLDDLRELQEGVRPAVAEDDRPRIGAGPRTCTKWMS